MTKTEYREYISSPQWQARRKEFLKSHDSCNACGLPRWLAVIAYDQDLHVHHVSYAHVGQELDEDLSPLCRRCHEVETFGFSNLHIVRSIQCTSCDGLIFDLIGRTCSRCHEKQFREDALTESYEHYHTSIQQVEQKYREEMKRANAIYEDNLERERNYEIKRQAGLLRTEGLPENDWK